MMNARAQCANVIRCQQPIGLNCRQGLNSLQVVSPTEKRTLPIMRILGDIENNYVKSVITFHFNIEMIDNGTKIMVCYSEKSVIERVRYSPMF